VECRSLNYFNEIKKIIYYFLFFHYIYLYFIYFCWTFMAGFNRRSRTLTVQTLSSVGQPHQARHNGVGIPILLIRNKICLSA
jgi:hypothetical protein